MWLCFNEERKQVFVFDVKKLVCSLGTVGYSTLYLLSILRMHGASTPFLTIIYSAVLWHWNKFILTSQHSRSMTSDPSIDTYK